MMIALNLIERGDRLRGACPEQVAALAASIGECGLISPITVYARDVVRAGIAVRGYGLIAGLHRLEAVRRLGLAEIEAHVVTLPELQRQLAECDENLCGTKLTPSERALFTRRRKEIYEALHPETRAHVAGGHGKHRSAADNLSFAEDTATKTGVDARTVRRDATRGERIAEDVLQQVRGTDLDKGVVLDRLARAADAAAELARIRAHNPPVAAAPLDEDEAIEGQVKRLIAAWNSAGPDARAEFLSRVRA
jgi:ParB family transcriptional regulator, chromosome partitioning protein